MTHCLQTRTRLEFYGFSALETRESDADCPKTQLKIRLLRKECKKRVVVRQLVYWDYLLRNYNEKAGRPNRFPSLRAKRGNLLRIRRSLDETRRRLPRFARNDGGGDHFRLEEAFLTIGCTMICYNFIRGSC